jgi:hypothetical protein
MPSKRNVFVSLTQMRQTHFDRIQAYLTTDDFEPTDLQVIDWALKVAAQYVEARQLDTRRFDQQD